MCVTDPVVEQIHGNIEIDTDRYISPGVVGPDRARLLCEVKSEKGSVAEAQESVDRRVKWIVHVFTSKGAQPGEISIRKHQSQTQTQLFVSFASVSATFSNLYDDQGVRLFLMLQTCPW